MTGKLQKLGQAVIETLTGHWPEKYSPYSEATAEERKALDGALEYFRQASGEFFDVAAKPPAGAESWELAKMQGQLVEVFSAALGFRNFKASPFDLFTPTITEVTETLQQAGDFAQGRAALLKGLSVL